MSMMGKMPKLGERGIIHFIVLLILLAGLVAGLYLVQHTQIFEPKAGGNITRVEIVDNDGNPIATTDTTKVKLKVTWVNLPEASESGNVNGVSSNKLLAQAPTEKLIRGPLTFISASPNPCPLGNVGSASEKHCKTAISWGTLSETDPIQVYVSRPGPGIPIPKQLFAANRSGTQTTLSWTIMGAVTSCDLSLGVSEDVSAQGGQASPIVTSGSKTITLTNSTSKSLTQTFTLGCSDGNGNAVQSSADVKVLPVLTECTVPQFVRSFNSYFGDSRYISICDFNKDEVINIFDIYYLLNQQPHI